MKKLQNLIIKDTITFNKAVKKLKKKYIHIENDYMNFVNTIETIEDLGTNLWNNIYKVRIKNSDKNSGKSSGYRLISHLNLLKMNFIWCLFMIKVKLRILMKKKLIHLF